MVVKRTVLLVVLFAALVGAAAVGAADQPVPAGFTANARLSAAASWVAGKSVTDYCATSDATFDASATRLPDWVGGDVGAVVGYSVIGTSASFLRLSECATLVQWNAAKRKVDPDALASALLTVGHEAELLSGESDESIADCKALAKMPAMVNRFFPLRKRLTMHALMRDAWDAHDSEPEQYHENCLSR